MINTNIINELKPHNKINNSDVSPCYFVAIEDISQKNECNQDYLEIDLIQINTPIQDIIENNPVFRKKLSITGVLELDENDFYSSKLIGFESEGTSSSKENTYSNNSHCIEVIDVQLSKEIDINFSRKYKSKETNTKIVLNDEQEEVEETKDSPILPSIIINIDKQYENLYRSYTTEYKKDSEENYIGVKIYFNNLKTKKTYPTIRITIIGEENPNYQPTTEEEPNEEPIEEEPSIEENPIEESD